MDFCDAWGGMGATDEVGFWLPGAAKVPLMKWAFEMPVAA
jgi:hypothetical protein